MIGVFIKFFISLVVLWFLLMYNLWKEDLSNEKFDKNLVKKSYNKFIRFIRKLWFAFLRFSLKIKNILNSFFQKLFFIIFPKAKKAFEKKDSLTGLDHGPSSYFLKTITPDKKPVYTKIKKNRRKPKNM